MKVNRSGFKPFMEYAGSYALFNYRQEDPSLGLEYSNLRLIRAFEHGHDPSSSEAGFVLVHVAMVRNSGRLVEGAVDALSACSSGDRGAFAAALGLVVQAMTDINAVMESMCFSLLMSRNPWNTPNKRTRRLTFAARYVETIKAKRLHEFPHLHFRHNKAVHVPSWRGIRRCERGTHVLSRRKRSQ